MKQNWNFLGGGRYKTKNLLWGEYGFFLELHNSEFIIVSVSLIKGKFEKSGPRFLKPSKDIHYASVSHLMEGQELMTWSLYLSY